MLRAPAARRGIPDVAVVGAGVVGAAVAYFLRREGLSVLVLDRGIPGGGTTGAAMGHLVAIDEPRPLGALVAHSLSFFGELASELPSSCEVIRCGTLWVAEEEGELGTAEEKRRRLADLGIEGELLDPRQLAEAEPFLRPGLAGGLRVPGDAVVYPPALARWFLDRSEAELRLGVTVSEVGPRKVVLADGTVEAGEVVNAAGVWAPELTPGLPIRPRKGHLSVTRRGPSLCRHQLAELGYHDKVRDLTAPSVAFNLQPRPGGQVLVGSSRQWDDWTPGVDRGILGRMLARAVHFVPALADREVIRSWVGFRPATSDGLPVIGRWFEGEGVWVAAGHEGLGITTAPGTARLLVDQLLGRPPAREVEPFLPTRFQRTVQG